MVRTPDPFWAFVEEMDDGCKKCKFCPHLYTHATSVSRVKRHLSGVRRYGVKICEKVPEDVQEAARQAIDSPPEKKLKTAASSSNNEAGDNRISTTLRQQQNNEAENGMMDCSPVSNLQWMPRCIAEIEIIGECISPGDHFKNTAMGLLQQGDATELKGMQMHSQLLATLQPADPERQVDEFVIDDVLMNDDRNMTRELLATLQPTDPERQVGEFVIDGVLMNDDRNMTRGLLATLQPTDPERQVGEFVIDGVLMNDDGNMTRGLLATLQPTDPERQVGEFVIDDVLMNDDRNMTRGLLATLQPTDPERQVGEFVIDDVLMNDDRNMTREPLATLQPTDPERQVGEFVIDDVLMNDDRNMTREPQQAIVMNRRVIEHDDEGTSHGELKVDAAEATLRTAQVGSECETAHCTLYLFTEDDVVSSNMENTTSTGLMQRIEVRGFPERFTVDECGQPTDLQCQVTEDHCNMICPSSNIDAVLRNDEENMNREPEQLVVSNCSHEGLRHIAEERRVAFPAPRLVGGEFQKYKNAIWSWLMNDEVSFIGIYGMGGVGKSTLVRYIYNQLLDASDKNRQVYWVTVSQDFSIYRLQNLIAKRIDVDLSNEDDEMHRAARLSKALAEKKELVLILDDLWNYFDSEKVGIPNKLNAGCKMLLTTRSLDVCRQMGCEGNVIKVEPLLEEEAWKLFKMELGNYDIKLEPLAKSVASECDGLPLAIKKLARSMRGAYDVCEWRNTLGELKESRIRQNDMEPEVFQILKFSYLHLKDSALQQCFLYCALFPKYFAIKREDLIEFLIAERIIEGRKSRQAEFDKGHDMLNRLENACLLEGVDGKRAVKMHDLLRDMALQELRKNSQVIVEAGEQLEELPDEEKWTQNLVRVSLMKNAIKEIPSGHSPSCPNLSTLLLCNNKVLKFIDDSFFKKLPRLEVLDLSCTAIQKLPDSVSDLVMLTALLLGKCYHLSHVPSLAKLKALKKLDLHSTALREVPPGLELLSSLSYLNLNDSRIQDFPAGILPKLCHLQVLKLDNRPYLNNVMTVQAEELACLRKLETLGCRSWKPQIANSPVCCLRKRKRERKEKKKQKKSSTE